MKKIKNIIDGNIVDIHNREIYPGTIDIIGEKITNIEKNNNVYSRYILPGIIDAHIHIESSMLTPGAFSVACVPHGTTGIIADPHEIANVLGMKGIEYMIEDAGKTPVKYWFGAPSCVPATDFESSGARLGYKEIEELIRRKEITHLGEMMNFPGVLSDEKDVISKINLAIKAGKPVDGHAPGLTGKNLKKYIDAGISTDHECSSIKEAKEKLLLGMKIIIREGSAARNLDALKELFREYPEKIMLCSDDIHPEMLEKRHINKIIARLISEGYDIFDVIRSTSINPAEHYKIDAGLMRAGDKADLIVVNDLHEMEIIETWINGQKVFENGKVLFKYHQGKPVNNFCCTDIKEEDIKVENQQKKFRIINAFDGELLTKEITGEAVTGDQPWPLPDKDILKIIVKDRYKNSCPATGFIKGFGIKKGAFASSIAHDSHNIIAVGTNDSDIVSAVNELIKIKGGLAVSIDGKVFSLKLNIAGIMSDKPCKTVAAKYEELSAMVKKLGCTMSAPFMTLSFMALLVIPELKISDRGLFDGKEFKHVPLFID